MTNLLPPERQRALARDFVLRVAVVVVVLVTSLVLVAGATLVPTYIYLQASVQVKKDRLANMERTYSSSDESTLEARLSALANNSATLVALGSTSPVSVVLQKVLAVVHPGITLSSFSYEPPMGSSALATIVVSGSSATREALHGYQLALQGAPFVKAAALPVSAYANDVDISFVITVTLAP